MRIYAVYAQAISGLIECFKGCGLWLPAIMLGSLLLEPFSCIRNFVEEVYYTFIRGEHDFSGVNPQALGERRQIRPILFLHGNYCTPAAGTGIASALEGAYAPPIFTVYLNSGNPSREDMGLIEDKIRQIKTLYRKEGVEGISIDIIAHSRGAFYAVSMAGRDDVNRIVLLGHRALFHYRNVLEINGRFDRMEFTEEEIARYAQNVQGEPNRRLLPNEGHVGLLYSDATHESIRDWLQPTSQL